MKTLLPLGVFSLFFLIPGMTTFAADYFPLNTGDVRYVDRIPQVIGEIENIDTLAYYNISEGATRYYCRKDESGKVYKKWTGKEEVLVYDLNVEVGKNWKCLLYNINYTVTLLSKVETVLTKFGKLTGCYKYSFKASNAYDADYIEYLAPDLGLVERGSNWGITGPLIKALINVQKIPDVTPLPEIIRTIPIEGQSISPVNAYIRIFLSYDIQQSSVNSQSIRVVSRENGVVNGTLDKNSANSYDMITFRPDKPLAANDVIDVTVSPGFLDYLGDTIAEPYYFSFTTSTITSITSPSQARPELISLNAYPNPFNPSTTISFTLPNAGPVNLIVYDTTGRKIKEFTYGLKLAGKYSVTFDGSHYASGLYFCILNAGNKFETRKILLLK
jgi:hypothetical protein